MLLIDFKIVYLIQVCVLLILLYFGRDFLKKRIITLFSNAKIPPFYFFGFRLLLGILLLDRLYNAYLRDALLIRPTSFLRIDAIFELFFHSSLGFLLLIVIPLIFIILFIFEWKPRLTSIIVFLYSVIGGTIYATVGGSLGQMQHKFHMTALLLLGFAFYYCFYHKNKAKKSNQWMILPILLFFIGTIYGSSFISKMSYLSEVPKWFTGEAVQSAIVKGHYQRVLTYEQEIGVLSPIPQLAISYKPLASFLGIGVLLSEFSSMLLLIVSSRLRFIILVLLVLFNVGSGVLILGDFFSGNIIVLLYLILWAFTSL